MLVRKYNNRGSIRVFLVKVIRCQHWLHAGPLRHNVEKIPEMWPFISHQLLEAVLGQILLLFDALPSILHEGQRRSKFCFHVCDFVANGFLRSLPVDVVF